MPRRNPGFGDHAPSLAGHIDRKYLETVLKGGVLPPNAVTWFLKINGNTVRPLPSHWLRAVQAACPPHLRPVSEEHLSAVVHTYYFERLAIISAVKEQELKARLDRIKTSAMALLEAVEIDGQDSVLAWEALESVEAGTLTRDDFYPALTMLINRAHRAQEIDGRLLNIRTGPNPELTWVNFVSGLIDIYRGAGGDIKITKRGGLAARPSAFSLFAWAIVENLPEISRQHSSDEWTLSEALAGARRKIDQGFLRDTKSAKPTE